MLSVQTPTLLELGNVKWTRKGPFRGNLDYPDTVPRSAPNDQDREITVKLSNNKILYKEGVWNDITSPNDIPTTTNPIVSENICLKRRVETLIRTAAISEIEVQQLKEEIREAKQILAQLAQVM
ncbi:hypothetical protein TRFO_06396 [Tritrichomonas foetus]|uniref:Uncharacterized protein n=1 Tax=Tritrichomonas foetus TaxID=1144522 RepID=A0A1J4K2Z8_9EUKA|nr:hypothetical protein TRFO_06396 [Tritrichomonas foetus]|eukprot:OHT04102.1 hypothetical protein TRFO_06396 [Tritrichomonas foetus]